MTLVLSVVVLTGEAEDEDEVLPVVLVTDDVSELTICVSMTGLVRVEASAGSAVLPRGVVTTRLLNCSAARLAPEVVTLSRLPETLDWVLRIWKLWSAVGWKPL